MPQQVVTDLSQHFALDPRFDGFFGAYFEIVRARSVDTRLGLPSFALVGVDPGDVDAVGAVPDGRGRPFAMSSLGPNQIVLSDSAARELNAQPGHTIEFLIGRSVHPLEVVEIAENTLITGWAPAIFGVAADGGGVVPIETMRRMLGARAPADGWSFAAAAAGGSVDGGLQFAETLNDDLERFLRGQAMAERGRAGEGVAVYLDAAGRPRLEAEAWKQDALNDAELASSALVLLFLFMGSFSVAAGVLLVFLIFAMLAEERRSEMGMSRAIGMQRDHLIQMFMSEGMAYNLGAAGVGVLLGLAISLGMIALLNQALDVFGFSFRWSVTVQSLIISAGIGIVITFITMTFSSFRASVLNIVAAIRDLPDSSAVQRRRISLAGIFTTPLGLFFLWTIPLTFVFGTVLTTLIGAAGGLRAARVPWLLAPAWQLMTWRAEWWPILIAGGVGLALHGISQELMITYYMGASIAPLGLVMLLTRLRLPARPLWTLASAFVLFIWFIPTTWHDRVFAIDLDGGPELFVVSGIMLTAAGTLLLIFNLDALVRAFQLPMSRFGRLAPILRAAAAYPLASRYRTGMTIAMITLIVFALVNFTTIQSSFNRAFTTEPAFGGFEVWVHTTELSGIDDLEAALQEAQAEETLERINAFGALHFADADGSNAVTQTSERWNASAQEPLRDADGEPIVQQLAARSSSQGELVFTAVDRGLIEHNEIALQARTRDYGSDEEVWAALARGEAVAVVSAEALAGGFGGQGDAWRLPSAVDANDTVLPRTTVRVGSGERAVDLSVIAVVQQSVGLVSLQGGGFGDGLPTMLVAESVWSQAADEAELTRHAVAVSDGDDALEVAQGIEAALIIEATDVKGELESAQRLFNSILQLFQAFIGIGLAAGLAALGVIAVRAVVERRQQIGVLRSIGFQSRSVGFEMLLEMGFIAFLGIALGTVLALGLAWRLFDEGTFGSDVSMYIPVGQIAPILIGALAASLLLTALPALQAARTTIAEALRYE